MRHHSHVLIVLAAVALGLALTGDAWASREVAEKEEMVCTACHDKPGSKLLTDSGKFYELKGSMEGFDGIKASFERCTYCHQRKPGSTKLTKAGKNFSTLINDMEGLLEWMKMEHPAVFEEPGSEVGGGADGAEIRLMPAH